MNKTEKHAIHAAIEGCTTAEAGRVSRAMNVLSARLGRNDSDTLSDLFSAFAVRAEARSNEVDIEGCPSSGTTQG
jgi:hypothetical protein